MAFTYAIAYFLTEGGSVVGACRMAIQTLLTDSARRMKMFSNPGQTYDDRGRVAGLQQALANLGGDLPTIDIAQSDTLPFDSAYIG